MEIADIYKVGSMEEIVGNREAVAQLNLFAADIENGRKRKPLLVYGPSGVGKTAAVHLLAESRGWHIVELNASDYRDRGSIERLVPGMASRATVFGNRKVMIFDEIDDFSFKASDSSQSAIVGIMEKSQVPVIAIANDMWDQRIAFLRGKVETVEFKKVGTADIAAALAKVAAKEGFSLERETIEAISARANGDVRSAINDAYALDGSSGKSIEALGLRDRKSEIFRVLDRIFMSNTLDVPAIALRNADLKPDMMMNWIDENIPKRYTDAGDLKRAFGALALATTFNARAVRSNYYAYWRYMNSLMSSGVALSKKNYPSTAERYSFPKRIKELSLSKGERAAVAGITKKMRRTVHFNAGSIAHNEMKVLGEMIKRSVEDGTEEKEVREFFLKNFNMEKKEVDAIAKMAV